MTTEGRLRPLAGAELTSETLVSVRVLAMAAYLFRGVFVEAAHGRPIRIILDERHEVFRPAESVVDRWSAYFRLEDENEN